MKKVLLVTLITFAIISKTEASQICQTLVDNVNSKITTDPNLCKIDINNPAQTLQCLKNGTCVKACIKRYLGDDKFKSFVCPTLITTLNHNEINKIDKDLSEICPMMVKPLLIAKNKLKQLQANALQDYNQETSYYLKPLKAAYQVALGAAVTAANNIITLAQSPMAQETCRNLLKKQVVTAPETEEPLTFAEFEAEQPKSMPAPRALPGPAISSSSIIPDTPPLNMEDGRHVARATARKIVEQTGPLSERDATEVAKEIKLAEVQAGVPIAPELGDELEEILRTGKFPTQKAVAATASAPVTPASKQQVMPSQGTVSGLFGDLQAAFAKKGLRTAVAGNDDNEDNEDWSN